MYVRLCLVFEQQRGADVGETLSCVSTAERC